VRACVRGSDWQFDCISSFVYISWSHALSAYKFTNRPFVFQTSTNFATSSCRPTTHVDRPRGTNTRLWSDSLSFEWRQHVITPRNKIDRSLHNETSSTGLLLNHFNVHRQQASKRRYALLRCSVSSLSRYALLFRDTIYITFSCDTVLRRGVSSISRYTWFPATPIRWHFFASPCCVLAFCPFLDMRCFFATPFIKRFLRHHVASCVSSISRYTWFFATHFWWLFCVTLLRASVSSLSRYALLFRDTIYITFFATPCCVVTFHLFLDIRGSRDTF